MRWAYFAGGCFWCITPTFRKLEGVSNVIAGFSGGAEQDPTYEAVKHQQTGHRETIAIHYDENLVGYRTLLNLFLAGVDPFDAGGQFIDRGHSYTLAVYYGTEAEREMAHLAIDAIRVESGREPQIAVEPFTVFYPAGEEHQDYYRKHPEAFHRELVESGRVKA